MTDGPELSCPVPAGDYERVVLSHGAGGRLMHRLIDDVFVEAFDEPELRRAHDGAVVDLKPPLAVTTDTFTVSPMFFPGGDIGSLAVYGTVNDVAMCGARPVYLSAAFVLEEGLPMSDLRRVVTSMAAAARRTRVHVVTGDTKVVERGNGDGVFITTTGMGSVVARGPIGPASLRAGDAILVSGPVGDHGVAVLAARSGLDLGGTLRSDAAAVADACLALIEDGLDVHALRDPTRGGLSSALNELADASGTGIVVDEAAIPIRPEVDDACEVLGLDPLYSACEGRFVAALPAAQAGRALEVLHANGCSQACRIGAVVKEHPKTVVLATPTGGRRVLDMLAGDQLPRIC